jgi:hypothetical protein
MIITDFSIRTKQAVLVIVVMTALLKSATMSVAQDIVATSTMEDNGEW